MDWARGLWVINWIEGSPHIGQLFLNKPSILPEFEDDELKSMFFVKISHGMVVIERRIWLKGCQAVFCKPSVMSNHRGHLLYALYSPFMDNYGELTLYWDDLILLLFCFLYSLFWFQSRLIKCINFIKSETLKPKIVVPKNSVIFFRCCASKSDIKLFINEKESTIGAVRMW